MAYSKAQLEEKLDSMGVQYDPDATASELKALYDELKTATVDESKGEPDTAPDSKPQEPQETTDSTEADKRDDTPTDGSPVIVVHQTCEKLYLRATPEKVSGNEIAILLGNKSHVAQEIGKEWTHLLDMDGYVASAFIEEV